MDAHKTESVTMTFSQDEDCAGRTGETFQQIIVKTCNGGTEPSDSYLVIETERWAIDPTPAGIAQFVAMLTKVAASVGVEVKAPKGSKS